MPYKVTIKIPAEEAPAAGFPVLYVLDGNAYGTMLSEILRLQWRRTEKTGIPSMIIVSIGYDHQEVFPPLRVYDFTQPSSASLPPKPNGKPWPAHGGADQFLSFLEEVVQPLVLEETPASSEEHLLFGHSLGGLFVLYALSRRPDLFRYYLSFSPSIWWNEGEIAHEVCPDCLVHDRKLFLAAEDTGRFSMYKNAFNLFEKLKGSRPEAVAFYAPPGENHMSIVPAAISQGIRFFHSKSPQPNAAPH